MLFNADSELILKKKKKTVMHICCNNSLELPCKDSSYEGSPHMFYHHMEEKLSQNYLSALISQALISPIYISQKVNFLEPEISL